MTIQIYNDDCINILEKISSNSIDCVITDCPYHIVHKGGGGRCEKRWKTEGQMKNYKNTKDGKMFDFNEIKFEQWLPHIYRVLKDNTHCYIMINSRNICELQNKAEDAGFKFQNLLVWKKNNATPNKFYMQQCEFILMLKKGKERWINNLGQKNVFEIKNNVGNKLHPTEKPVELMNIFVQNSTNEGDIVLDPFMGSGTTGISCKELGRNFIGIELDEKYYNIAKHRIENYGGLFQ